MASSAPPTRPRLTLGGREQRKGPPERFETHAAALEPLRGCPGRTPVSRSRRQGLTRGLLASQGRDVQETPSGAVDALRPSGLIPSTLRACLHAWVYLLGKPFVLTTPGGEPVAV